MAGLVGRCGDLEFSGGTAIYDPQGRAVARVESGEGMASPTSTAPRSTRRDGSTRTSATASTTECRTGSVLTLG